MRNDDKNAPAKIIGVLAGLALGQGIIFSIINPNGWQPVDKGLFGLAIGVGLAGLFYVAVDATTKKKNK